MASASLETDPSLVDARTVLRRVRSDPDLGLSADDAAQRLATVGPNEITTAKPVSSWLKLVAQFRDPLIYLLLAAIVIAVVAWWAEGAHGLPFDALVIAVIVVANAILGYVQEARAERAVDRLLALPSLGRAEHSGRQSRHRRHAVP